MKLTERCATQADSSELFDLYTELLRSPIEGQWGWNETFQKENFSQNLPARKFTLFLVSNTLVAACFINSEIDHFYIKMLLVTKAYQHQGIGRRIIEKLQVRATQEQKPIKLSVIKANPVLGFYTTLGFVVTGENEDSLFLEYKKGRAS